MENKYSIKKQNINTNTNSNSDNSKLRLKKINVEFPVNFRSVDYFKVVDAIRSSIKSSSNEIGRNNIENSTIYL